jgi:hypothetical protein
MKTWSEILKNVVKCRETIRSLALKNKENISLLLKESRYCLVLKVLEREDVKSQIIQT